MILLELETEVQVTSRLHSTVVEHLLKTVYRGESLNLLLRYDTIIIYNTNRMCSAVNSCDVEIRYCLVVEIHSSSRQQNNIVLHIVVISGQNWALLCDGLLCSDIGRGQLRGRSARRLVHQRPVLGRGSVGPWTVSIFRGRIQHSGLTYYRNVNMDKQRWYMVWTGRWKNVRSFSLISESRLIQFVTPVLRELYWMPIRQRISFMLALLVYKILMSAHHWRILLFELKNLLVPQIFYNSVIECFCIVRHQTNFMDTL